MYPCSDDRAVEEVPTPVGDVWSLGGVWATVGSVGHCGPLWGLWATVGNCGALWATVGHQIHRSRDALQPRSSPKREKVGM